MVRYGKDTLPADWGNDEQKDVTWGTRWCSAEDSEFIDCFIINVTAEFPCKMVVAPSAGGGECYALIYRFEDGRPVLIAETQTINADGSWDEQQFPLAAPLTLSPGTYAVAPRGPSIGIPYTMPHDPGLVWRYGYGDQYSGKPSELPESPPPRLIVNGIATIYLTDEEPTPLPLPLPPTPAAAMLIPTLQTRVSAMRGYGGFLDGLWTIKNYRFPRMQVYGSLNADGSLTPLANWNPAGGNEGGATWGVIEQFLADVAAWGGIPNLSLWIHNWEELADDYSWTLNVIPQTLLFQKLKQLMQKYGITEMILEPAWEWNGDSPVSDAQQRNAHIEPLPFAYGMAALRAARDTVGINCSLISHMLAIHGDAWYLPDQETWKRTYMMPWFVGMSYSDGVTTSLYLSDEDKKWTGDWFTYLDWVYEYVVGLQKMEVGWAPAVYLGTTEHNLKTNGIWNAPKEVYEYDFQKMVAAKLPLFGWWRPFEIETANEQVKTLAEAFQKSSITPEPLFPRIRNFISNFPRIDNALNKALEM